VQLDELSHQRQPDPQHDPEEQAELLDRLDELLVFDRLGDVDVASQAIAPLDLARVVGRGEHD